MDVRITIIVGVESNNFYAKIYTALNKEETATTKNVVAVKIYCGFLEKAN